MEYRLGKKQSRALLDKKGHEVALFNKGQEDLAKKVCQLINTDLETKLNYFLNDAFKVQRLRNHPNSNNIAEFVINWMKTNK
tara:strand:+ start:67 stop:312 length:246 start_codon:yes stop_codon:yes gene_type:complete